MSYHSGPTRTSTVADKFLQQHFAKANPTLYTRITTTAPAIRTEIQAKITEFDTAYPRTSLELKQCIHQQIAENCLLAAGKTKILPNLITLALPTIGNIAHLWLSPLTRWFDSFFLPFADTTILSLFANLSSPLSVKRIAIPGFCRAIQDLSDRTDDRAIILSLALESEQDLIEKFPSIWRALSEQIASLAAAPIGLGIYRLINSYFQDPLNVETTATENERVTTMLFSIISFMVATVRFGLLRERLNEEAQDFTKDMLLYTCLYRVLYRYCRKEKLQANVVNNIISNLSLASVRKIWLKIQTNAHFKTLFDAQFDSQKKDLDIDKLALLRQLEDKKYDNASQLDRLSRTREATAAPAAPISHPIINPSSISVSLLSSPPPAIPVSPLPVVVAKLAPPVPIPDTESPLSHCPEISRNTSRLRKKERHRRRAVEKAATQSSASDSPPTPTQAVRTYSARMPAAVSRPTSGEIPPLTSHPRLVAVAPSSPTEHSRLTFTPQAAAKFWGKLSLPAKTSPTATGANTPSSSLPSSTSSSIASPRSESPRSDSPVLQGILNASSAFSSQAPAFVPTSQRIQNVRTELIQASTIYQNLQRKLTTPFLRRYVYLQTCNIHSCLTTLEILLESPSLTQGVIEIYAAREEYWKNIVKKLTVIMNQNFADVDTPHLAELSACQNYHNQHVAILVELIGYEFELKLPPTADDILRKQAQYYFAAFFAPPLPEIKVSTIREFCHTNTTLHNMALGLIDINPHLEVSQAGTRNLMLETADDVDVIVCPTLTLDKDSTDVMDIQAVNLLVRRYLEGEQRRTDCWYSDPTSVKHTPDRYITQSFVYIQHSHRYHTLDLDVVCYPHNSFQDFSRNMEERWFNCAAVRGNLATLTTFIIPSGMSSILAKQIEFLPIEPIDPLGHYQRQTLAFKLWTKKTPSFTASTKFLKFFDENFPDPLTKLYFGTNLLNHTKSHIQLLDRYLKVIIEPLKILLQSEPDLAALAPSVLYTGGYMLEHTLQVLWSTLFQLPNSFSIRGHVLLVLCCINIQPTPTVPAARIKFFLQQSFNKPAFARSSISEMGDIFGRLYEDCQIYITTGQWQLKANSHDLESNLAHTCKYYLQSLLGYPS